MTVIILLIMCTITKNFLANTQVCACQKFLAEIYSADKKVLPCIIVE